jgi:hypothetical protein
MRDLHLSHEDIGNLTLPQVYVYMQCLREVNEAHAKEHEREKAKIELLALKARGR